MKREAEFTGKKVQDAVNEGLQTLGLTLDDVEIKIESNGGLFKKAKVIITYDDGKAEGEEVRPEVKPTQPEKSTKTEKAPTSEKPRKKAEAPTDEPHWGSDPVKREPTTISDFGKAEQKPAEQKENKPPRENKQPREQKPKEEKGKEKKKQRESVPPTEEQIALAKTFLTELLQHMHIEGEVQITVDEGMRINVDTEDARVIGHRGEVLDAMQQLVSTQINTSHGKFVHVTVDGLGYRDRRKDTLEGLARRMADKAVRTHRKVTLDPMNSADRRIVHAALGEREDVFTRSEGHEPARRVAIIPKRK